jgi:hypothetical protein
MTADPNPQVTRSVRSWRTKDEHCQCAGTVWIKHCGRASAPSRNARFVPGAIRIEQRVVVPDGTDLTAIGVRVDEGIYYYVGILPVRIIELRKCLKEKLFRDVGANLM